MMQTPAPEPHQLDMEETRRTITAMNKALIAEFHGHPTRMIFCAQAAAMEATLPVARGLMGAWLTEDEYVEIVRDIFRQCAAKYIQSLEQHPMFTQGHQPGHA